MSGERGGSTSTICWRVCQSGVLPAHLPERRLAGVSAGATTRRHVHRSGDAAARPPERRRGGASQSSGEESRRRTSSSAERRRGLLARPPRQSGGEESWRVLLGKAAERSPGSATAKPYLRKVCLSRLILWSLEKMSRIEDVEPKERAVEPLPLD
ncbi:hypothetical protein GUJ93_ZPchr0012g21694 [Zizania palustris]|uniref:Uncharacterized protein n=1 Tax=Zizania palustris TaxID=103762 RepID=A0A8J6BZJ9_ZIZPA|nr:hypothetical protein GUJ93_ZPchr0012g21694 [Zizania palustris]